MRVALLLLPRSVHDVVRIQCDSPHDYSSLFWLLVHTIQDGSLELESRYGCTQPSMKEEDDDYDQALNTCGVAYDIAESYDTPSTLAAVKIGVLWIGFNANVCTRSGKKHARGWY